MAVLTRRLLTCRGDELELVLKCDSLGDATIQIRTTDADDDYAIAVLSLDDVGHIREYLRELGEGARRLLECAR
jgi:hypothetical protein